MNIFRREMKAHRWGLLFWSLGMVLLVVSGMAKFAAYVGPGSRSSRSWARCPRPCR